MADFTPGPWLIQIGFDKEIFIVEGPEGDPGGSILEGGFVLHDDDENLANARLMAASPELYEALLDLSGATLILNTTNETSMAALGRCVVRARHALARARGEI
jgi:hypothetical protein